ncbi:Killer protein [Duganella sp. FT80W]|uniref:Killer protein n=1 Tax=Duganella guangzhouensis TaxID=2666084 RepID=A0A6I2KX61_9BURK|nr:Killer protein [Duganella guangzhouensis]
MITSFKHKGLYRFYALGDQSGIPAAFAARITRMLDRLNSCVQPDDMDLPGYKFHQLKGNRQGVYSVQVSGNWRLTFSFSNGDAHNVRLEDYH